MCWYSYLIGDMQKCYSLRHHVASLIQKLGLGYEANKSSQDIFYVEIRRRTFWVAYAIEQWLACCTGGERLLSDTNMTRKWDCKYPHLEDNQLLALSRRQNSDNKVTDETCFSLESALQVSAFAEMIRLSNIVGDICDGILPSSQLETNLTSWLLQLPSYLDYGHHDESTCPSPIAKVYRILYYTVQIMLKMGNHNNQLSTSICTTAANTIVHISEQMMDQQEKYIYNLFFSSMTLAASIHLDNITMSKNNNNASDKIHLSKSMSLIKDMNCTLLGRSELDQLIHHFLADRCNVFLDLVYPSPSNSSSSYPTVRTTSSQPCITNSNNKRILLNYEDEEPYGFSNTNLNTPFDQQHFNLDDIFPNIIQDDSWSSWVIDFFDNNTLETTSTATCSPASNCTPSQSPSLSLHLKEEMTNNAQYFIETLHSL